MVAGDTLAGFAFDVGERRSEFRPRPQLELLSERELEFEPEFDRELESVPESEFDIELEPISVPEFRSKLESKMFQMCCRYTLVS